MRMNKDDSNLFEMAQKSANAGDRERAIILLTDLTDKYPKNGLLHAVLALRFKEIGLSDQSEIEFRKAVALCPKNEHCSLGLFHLLWGYDKQIEALDEMKRFLSISKSNEYSEILSAIIAEREARNSK